jgi:heat shock protein HslJ
MKRMMGLLVAVGLVACVGGGPLTDAAASLAGTSWVLAQLDGQAPVPVPDGAAPTLQFRADEAGGSSGCNSFGGPYTQSGGSLRFGPLASTRRACTDEAANAQEAAYFRALEAVTRAGTAGGTLVLYAGDRAVARFRPAAG